MKMKKRRYVNTMTRWQTLVRPLLWSHMARLSCTAGTFSNIWNHFVKTHYILLILVCIHVFISFLYHVSQISLTSNTELGQKQDTVSNDLFPFIIYQVKYFYNITILAFQLILLNCIRPGCLTFRTTLLSTISKFNQDLSMLRKSLQCFLICMKTSPWSSLHCLNFKLQVRNKASDLLDVHLWNHLHAFVAAHLYRSLTNIVFISTNLSLSTSQ